MVASGKVINSLDGSCCDNMEAEADGMSPETCKTMMSSQAVPKIKTAIEKACGPSHEIPQILSMFDVFSKQKQIAPAAGLSMFNVAVLAFMSAVVGGAVTASIVLKVSQRRDVFAPVLLG
jgi:hypothetical protein